MSQNEIVLKHLKSGRSLTPGAALDRFGIFRLAARIHDLKQQGHRIETHTVKFGRKKWASYLLDRA
jgi:helix-turn-helix protein